MFQEPTQLYEINYTHTYFPLTITMFGKNPKSRHACLDVGEWCEEQYEEEFEAGGQLVG